MLVDKQTELFSLNRRRHYNGWRYQNFLEEDNHMFPEVDWQVVLYHLVHLALAFILALPIGWNREQGAKSAGLRTFPLVALGACAFMLIGTSVFNDQQAQSRIIYGIVTGIGFIGGGAILKEQSHKMVIGTATAASIWNTGAIGVAVAWDRIEIALTLSILNFLVLYFVTPLKDKVDNGQADEKTQ